MAQQKKITLVLPGALTLTEEQRAAIQSAISVQLAGVMPAALLDDPPPLPEINDPVRAAKRATKRGGTKKSSKSSQSGRSSKKK